MGGEDVPTYYPGAYLLLRIRITTDGSASEKCSPSGPEERSHSGWNGSGLGMVVTQGSQGTPNVVTSRVLRVTRKRLINTFDCHSWWRWAECHTMKSRICRDGIGRGSLGGFGHCYTAVLRSIVTRPHLGGGKTFAHGPRSLTAVGGSPTTLGTGPLFFITCRALKMC